MIIYFFLLTLGSVYCYLSTSLGLEGFKSDKMKNKLKKNEAKAKTESSNNNNDIGNTSEESEESDLCKKAEKCNKDKSKGDIIKEVKRIIKRAKKYTKNFRNIFVKMGEGIGAFFTWLFKSLMCLDSLIIELFTSKIIGWFNALQWYWKIIVVILILVLLFFTWIIWLPILVFYYVMIGLRMIFAYKEWKAQQARTKRCKIKYVKQQWEKVADKFPNKDNFAMLNPAYIILGNQCLNAENECEKHKAKMEAAARAQADADATAAAARAKAKIEPQKQIEEVDESKSYFGFILLAIGIIAMSITILNFNKNEGSGGNDMVGGNGADSVDGVGGGEIHGASLATNNNGLEGKHPPH